MGFGNIFVLVFLSYYTIYFLSFFSNDKRQAIQNKNLKLNELRNKGFKSLEEQKEFINLKYPKIGKFVFSWLNVGKVFIRIAIFVFIYAVYGILFKIGKIDFAIWQGILIIILMPVVINIILSIFNLQKEDIRVFLR